MPSLCSKSILNDEEQWEMWPVLEVSSLCLGAGGAGDVARKAAVTWVILSHFCSHTCTCSFNHQAPKMEREVCL